MSAIETLTKVTVSNISSLFKSAQNYKVPENDEEREVLEFIIDKLKKEKNAIPRKKGNLEMRRVITFAIGELEDKHDEYIMNKMLTHPE